jgi:hypothetical protein
MTAKKPMTEMRMGGFFTGQLPPRRCVSTDDLGRRAVDRHHLTGRPDNATVIQADVADADITRTR